MLFTALLLSSSLVQAAGLSDAGSPIRKVVTLLQDMQKEIEDEGAKEQDAFDKFMCYCDGSTGDMQKGATEGAQKAEELGSKLEALKAEKTQLEQELVQHKSDRAAATQDTEKAQSLRDKEAAEFTAAELDLKTNIAAMKGAISALEKGTALLQLPQQQMVRVQRAVAAATTTDDFEKQSLLSVLQGGQQMGNTDQIIGMLKAMQEEMEGDLASAQGTEQSAQASAGELNDAKAGEIAAATAAIESKTKRSGETAVEIAQTADDLEDTQADVTETQKFLKDLDTQCASKKSEWSSRQKMRAEEIAAVGMAIKVLNDDDSLDLFKKTSFAQESSGLEFLQTRARVSPALRARNLLISLAQKSTSHTSQLALLASTLKAKAVDFSKIETMISDMIRLLGNEQNDDDTQKKFCEAEFAKSGAEKKRTEEQIGELQASLDEMGQTVETLGGEVATLQSEITSLDKAVAEATQQRKDAHNAFLTEQAENQAAQQLIEKAKNVLNKFYRPNLYKAPPKSELSMEDQVLASSGREDLMSTEAPNMIGGTTQTVYAQVRLAQASGAVPPPPPETFGAYTKKDGKSNGVMALMDQMVGDLKSDMTDAKHAEETDQADYERLMSASQSTREANARSITEKEGAKADWQEKIESENEETASAKDAMLKLGEYIAGLHSSCDFLVENHGARKEARTNEIEGLKNAKAVLAGASFE